MFEQEGRAREGDMLAIAREVTRSAALRLISSREREAFNPTEHKIRVQPEQEAIDPLIRRFVKDIYRGRRVIIDGIELQFYGQEHLFYKNSPFAGLHLSEVPFHLTITVQPRNFTAKEAQVFPSTKFAGIMLPETVKSPNIRIFPFKSGMCTVLNFNPEEWQNASDILHGLPDTIMRRTQMMGFGYLGVTGLGMMFHRAADKGEKNFIQYIANPL